MNKGKQNNKTNVEILFKDIQKKQEGITLIALIITIIILLILSAVSVTVALNGDIFNKASEGVAKTNANAGKLQSSTTYFSEKLKSIKEIDLERIKENERKIRKIKNWIPAIETAEGALSETHEMLGRLNELTIVIMNNESLNEADKGNIIDEVEQLLQEITRVAEDTEYDTIKMLDGSFSRHLDVDNVVLTIENCSAESLSLVIPNLRETLMTKEGAEAYLANVEGAIRLISKTRSKLGASQNKLQDVWDFYEAENDILSSYRNGADKYLAEEELIHIKAILDRCYTLTGQGMEDNYNDVSRESIQLEVKALVEAIDIITKEEYKGVNVLDGTHLDIPRIDLETLGIAEHTSIVSPSIEDMQTMHEQYKSAIQMVKVELDKF